MATTLEQIQALAEQLSLEEKKRAIEIMQELIYAETPKSELPPGTPGSFFLKFSFAPEEVDVVNRAMEECERIYPDE
jgi:hypothetical protein